MARGLEPMVTLHHFTHPWWLGEEFWLRPGSPDVFARHVARVVPALAPYCRRWVTVNEPNIVTLMGWIEGACPPGRRMAVSDAFCVLDNLLDRARPGRRRRQRRAARGRGDHQHQLVFGLRTRPHAARPPLTARRRRRGRVTSTAISTNAGRSTTPPSRRATPGRRPSAGSSPPCRPTGRSDAPGQGPVWAACAASPGAPPARVVDAVHASTRPAPLDAIGFDWYDPVASHAIRVPGRRRPPAGGDWSFGRAIWDVESHPGRTALLVCHRVRPASRPPAVGRRERHGDPGPRRAAVAREDGHGSAPLRARAPGGGGRRRGRRGARARLPPLVAGRQLRVGHLRAALRPLRHGPQRSDALRWMDTDAQGDDAAGEYARVLAGLRAGDRSVLDPPA